MRRTLPILMAAFFLRGTCVADGPTFDAASVKVQDPIAPKIFQMSGGPGSSDPGRFRAHLNMSSLLSAAFGVQVDQIKGPAWLRDFSAMPFYDIVATMPGDTTKEQCEKMMQNMLVERFHLVFHYDTMNAPGYDLVADKGGPKLKEVTPEPESISGASATSGANGPDGFPVLPGSRTMGFGSTAHQRRKFQEYTMAQFAANLGFLLGRALGRSLDEGVLQPRVADKTGLTGKYTFILEYECAACAPLIAKPSDASDTAANEPASPEIFSALQKELGLRLEKTQDVPLKVVVVDSVDKIPTVN